jgi:hypothetical protein
MEFVYEEVTFVWNLGLLLLGTQQTVHLECTIPPNKTKPTADYEY